MSFTADPEQDEVPECTECGACCFSQLERYVHVSGDDYAAMGEAAERWITFEGQRAHLRMTGGRCSALAIEWIEAEFIEATSGEADATQGKPEGRGRFTCATYATRPQTCRTLERGGPMCRAERDAKASRALLSARALIRHRG